MRKKLICLKASLVFHTGSGKHSHEEQKRLLFKAGINSAPYRWHFDSSSIAFEKALRTFDCCGPYTPKKFSSLKLPFKFVLYKSGDLFLKPGKPTSYGKLIVCRVLADLRM